MIHPFPAFSVQGFIDATGATHPVLRMGGPVRISYQMGVDNYAIIDANGIVRYMSTIDGWGGFNDAQLRATIDEWLLAAEYILDGGNHNVMLCERGIRTFESHTRFTLPLAVAKKINRFSGYSRTGKIAVIRSFSSSGSRFTIGRPRAVRLPIGS